MNEVQRIDLNDYVQTGEGGTAQAYGSLIEFFGIK